MSLGTPPAPTPAHTAAAHAAAAATTAATAAPASTRAATTSAAVAPASTRVPPPPPPLRRAQVYKKLGDSSKAMVNFTRALDLSPKDAQQIKTAILNLEKEDAAGDDDEY